MRPSVYPLWIHGLWERLTDTSSIPVEWDMHSYWNVIPQGSTFFRIVLEYMASTFKGSFEIGVSDVFLVGGLLWRGLEELFRTRECELPKIIYSNVIFSFLFTVFSSFLLPHYQFSNNSSRIAAAFLWCFMFFLYHYSRGIWGRHYYPQFRDEEAESQRSKEKLLWSHS